MLEGSKQRPESKQGGSSRNREGCRVKATMQSSKRWASCGFGATRAHLSEGPNEWSKRTFLREAGQEANPDSDL